MAESNIPNMSMVDDESTEMGYSHRLFNASSYYTTNEFKQVTDECLNRPLAILNTNARSLLKQKSDYEIFLQDLYSHNGFSFDVLTFEESWLDENNSALANIDGYNLITKHKAGSKIGGGIAVLVRTHISFNVRDISVPSHLQNLFDCLFLDIRVGSIDIVLGVFYRSPSVNTVKELCTFLHPLLENLKSEKKEIIIMGDMNIDLLKTESHNDTAEYLDTFLEHGFIPKITVPTRITHQSATLIDHIFVKLSDVEHNCGTITTDISDHYCNFILSNINKKQTQSKYISYRNTSQEAVLKLCEDLRAFNWTQIYSIQDPNVAYTEFLKIFHDKMDKNMPKKTVRFNTKKHLKKAWITKGILSSIQQRNLLYKKAMKCKNKEIQSMCLDNYRSYRNTLNKVIRNAKEIYWKDIFDKCRHDMKQTWKNINKLLNKSKANQSYPDFFEINGVKTYEKTTICEKFNEYFTNIGRELSAKLPKPKQTPESWLPNIEGNNSFFMTPTNETELTKIIHKLKPKVSTGFDDISSKLVKQTHEAIIGPLVHIINLSICQGIFPNDMKIAKVLPIFKSGNQYSLKNYRPISLLPAFSKVIERVVYNKLYDYLTSKNILLPNQYGFRKFHSTEQAILDFGNIINNHLINNKIPIAIFLDLTKAFDTIDHKLLLSKLEHYGIRGIPLSWFKSYLEHRKQSTVINETCSSAQNIMFGVPQGSILGPLLFIIYINDITHATSAGKYILFADDTSIVFTLGDDNNDHATKEVEKELVKVCDWFNANKLSVNELKTKVMCFKSTGDHNVTLKLNDTPIENVTNFKFLGITISNNLSWKAHVNLKCNQINKVIAVMSRLKNEISSQILAQIYRSLIDPYINYGLIAWGNNEGKGIARIEKLQKKAMRIICKVNYNSHTSNLFFNLGILPVRALYVYKCCLMYNKIRSGEFPSHFQTLFPTNNTIHSHNTRSNMDIHIPNVTHRLSKNTINYKLGTVWNKLPDYLKHGLFVSHSAFKKSLKKFLLEPYGHPCTESNCYICLR